MRTISMCTACSVRPCICHGTCTVSHACIVCIYITKLIHHITTYYQMIFLDNAHLAGKLHQLDFAWILFSKVQALLQQTCTSTVANTLRMFLPLSNLVNKMQHVLTPAQHLSRYEAHEAAKSFVSWIVQQLQQVREAANTAQRYTNIDTSVNVDFAPLGKPTHHVFNKTLAPQAAAAVANSRPPVRRYDNSKRLGMQNSGPSRAGAPPSQQPRSFRIQDLKEAVNSIGPTADESIIQWTKDVLLNQPEHLVPADMKQTLRFLVKNDSSLDTLHCALSTVTVEFLPRVPRVQGAVITQYMKTSFLYHKRCALCVLAVSTTPRQAIMPLRVARPCRQYSLQRSTRA